MKKIILILFALFGLSILNSCMYDKLSHVSDNDLIWVLSRDDGESHIFESDNGKLSGIVYYGQVIHNETKRVTTDVLHYFNVSPVYEAYALCDFTVIQNANLIKGFLMVKAEVDSNKPLLDIMFGGLIYEGNLTNLHDTIIDNKTYKDCLTVDYISGKRYPGQQWCRGTHLRFARDAATCPGRQNC